MLAVVLELQPKVVAAVADTAVAVAADTAVAVDCTAIAAIGFHKGRSTMAFSYSHMDLVSCYYAC